MHANGSLRRCAWWSPKRSSPETGAPCGPVRPLCVPRTTVRCRESAAALSEPRSHARSARSFVTAVRLLDLRLRAHRAHRVSVSIGKIDDAEEPCLAHAARNAHGEERRGSRIYLSLLLIMHKIRIFHEYYYIESREVAVGDRYVFEALKC